LADSTITRYVWNYYNRVPRHLQRLSNSSHTYGTATWRRWDNSGNARVYLLQGILEDSVHVSIWGQQQDTAYLSFGVDSSSTLALSNFSVGTANAIRIGGSTELYMPSAGYHYIYALEFGGSASSLFTRYWVFVQLLG